MKDRETAIVVRSIANQNYFGRDDLVEISVTHIEYYISTPLVVKISKRSCNEVIFGK